MFCTQFKPGFGKHSYDLEVNFTWVYKKKIRLKKVSPDEEKIKICNSAELDN